MAAVENDVAASGPWKRIGINQLHAVIGGRLLFRAKLQRVALDRFKARKATAGVSAS